MIIKLHNNILGRYPRTDGHINDYVNSTQVLLITETCIIFYLLLIGRYFTYYNIFRSYTIYRRVQDTWINVSRGHPSREFGTFNIIYYRTMEFIPPSHHPPYLTWLVHKSCRWVYSIIYNSITFDESFWKVCISGDCRRNSDATIIILYTWTKIAYIDYVYCVGIYII